MKKKLIDAYSEDLLSENAEDALLESYFQQQRKKQFDEKVRQAMEHHAVLQRRFKMYRLTAILTGGLLLTCGSAYFWKQNMQKKESKRIEKHQKNPNESLPDKSYAFFLEKTVDPAYKPRLSETLMDVSKTPITPIPLPAQTAYSKGNYAETVKILESLGRKDAAIWSHIGFCYMQMALDDKALQAFQKSTNADKLFSGQHNIIWWTILIHCRQAQWTQAKILLQQLPEEHYARQEGWNEILLKNVESQILK